MLAKHVVAAIAIGLAAVGCSALNQSTPTPPPMSVQVQTWYSGTKPRFEEMVAAGNALAQANENEDLAARQFVMSATARRRSQHARAHAYT